MDAIIRSARIIGGGPTSMAPTSVTYVGPGDIVSGARGWWGLRAYSNATMGTNAIRLRRDSDNAELDFTTLSPSGALDEASITTWAGGANLFITKAYDQSGNSQDAAQATFAKQLPFLRNGLGSHSVATGIVGSPCGLLTGATFSFVVPLTVVFVAFWNSGGTNEPQYLTGNTTGSFAWGFTGNLTPPQKVRAVDGLVFDTTVTNTNSWHTFISVDNGDATSTNFVDGVTTTGDMGSTSVSGQIAGVGGLAVSQDPEKPQVEWGIWPGAFTSGNKTSMESNAKNYWGYT